LFRVLPPGTFYELYAVTDAIVATSYFYNLSMLHLTELSRRFDANYMKSPHVDLARMAYLTLTRMMTFFPFFDDQIKLYPLLALCSMVINPRYYVHPNWQAQDWALRVHTACWRFLAYVDPLLPINQLDSSLALHCLSRRQHVQPLENDPSKFNVYPYPLQNDTEYSLELARTIEKCLGKNSQTFRVQVDHSDLLISGMDFLPVVNFTWNPKLNDLHKDLRNYVDKRQWDLRNENITKTREAIVKSVTSPQ
jgi:hypothetical protein